jgi:hypothetical protein
MMSPLHWSSWTFLLLIGASLGVRMLLPARSAGLLRLARELFLMLPAALLYFLVRGLVHARADDAMHNADRVIHFEQTLGIFHEASFQRQIVSSDTLVTLFNWMYIWGHWPVITAVLTWLVIRHKDEFPTYRNALLLSGALAMLIFMFFPVAPPRLTEGFGFVDTVTLHSDSYRVLQPTSLTNPFASVPSLHFGWDLLMGIALFRLASHRAARLLGLLLPVAMLLAIVLTGNHYLIDAVLGGGLVLASLYLTSVAPQYLSSLRHQLAVASRRRARRARTSAGYRHSERPSLRQGDRYHV